MLIVQLFWVSTKARNRRRALEAELDLSIDYFPDEDDQHEVIDEIKDLKADYFNLGTALKLRFNTVDNIRKKKLDHKEALHEVINEWLLKNYNCKKFGEPNWKSLVLAVASSMGGNNTDLAMKIAAKHPAKHPAGKPLLCHPTHKRIQTAQTSV